MESENDTSIELDENFIVEDDEREKGKRTTITQQQQARRISFNLSSLKICWDYFLYVVCFYVLAQFTVHRKMESFSEAIIVFFLMGLFGSIFYKKKAPKSHPFLVAITACLTTSIYMEAALRSEIVKDSFIVTVYSNLFTLMFFIPGALGFRFSPFFLILLVILGELFGLFQFYSMLFRGFPFYPEDVEFLEGAFEMRHEYSLIHPEGVSMMGLAILNVVCVARFAFNKDAIPVTNRARKILALFFVFLLNFFGFGYSHITHVLIEKKVFVAWDLPALYPRAGNLFAFYVDLRQIFAVTAPAGYSAEESKQILAKFESKNPVDKSKLRKPNIIAIMSESFCDYRILGKFETNQDYMPFIRSLKDNTAKGYVSVSAYGSHSCNSEYEFLTGNSMGFYSFGKNAYNGIVNENQEALTFLLNDLGYNTIVCAPSSKGIWAMDKNYGILEFNETYYKNEYYTVRDTHNGRVSDRDLLHGALNIYNNRPRDQPLFMFLSTMQNHKDYKKISYPSVYAKGYKDDDALSCYLTGLKLTDDATKEFLDHFSKVKEDVVIVFYGDHHPHLPSFTEKYLGSSMINLPLEKRVLLHTTPYFIWTNFKTEAQEENISLSYLSTKLFEIAGLPKTTYMNFLDYTKRYVPMLTPYGYMEPDKVWHSRNDRNPYLDQYFQVQHYMMTDYRRKKN